MSLVMSTVHDEDTLTCLSHPSSDKFIKENSAFLWTCHMHFRRVQLSIPVFYSTSQGCTLLYTDLQTRARMLAAYSHPVIQLMHPIFGYITSNALFHLSSLHFPIQTTFPFSYHHAVFLNLYVRQSSGDYQNSLQPK